MNLLRLWLIPCAFSLSMALAGEPMSLKDVRSFMVQEQGLESRHAIAALAQSSYDMLIIDCLSTLKNGEDVDMAQLIRQLREGRPGRLVLAYFPFAEAESERFYWNGWKAPGTASKGTPDFLLGPDPEGWSDTYVVAYWDKRWQDLIVHDKDSLLHKTLAAGFDGLMLDWADGYDADLIRQEGTRQQVAPARAMVDLIIAISKEAKRINPRVLILAGDSVTLGDVDPRYTNAIDALLSQGTWYHGKTSAPWDDVEGGDIPNRASGHRSIESLLACYPRYLAAGKPVFTIDYCLKAENAAKVYADAKRLGLIPLVSQVSLAGVTKTPPPDLPKH